MHVTDLGADVVGANVYLFSETGSYLGVNTTADTLGMASFLQYLPRRTSSGVGYLFNPKKISCLVKACIRGVLYLNGIN